MLMMSEMAMRMAIPKMVIGIIGWQPLQTGFINMPEPM
jgi:hypothetical protein